MKPPPPGPPPPPPPIPESWTGIEKIQSSQEATQLPLKPGQIQFLKKIRDTPLTRELLDYYKNKRYYQDLVEGDVEEFILRLSDHGYIEKASESPETWYCSEKGVQATSLLIAQARTSEKELMQTLANLNASESLKIATELKRAGNLNAAVKALEESYDKIRNSKTFYGVETFLRLPGYLQAAGRSDEAWGYLNKLLTQGYPNQLESDQSKALDRSRIYSSMSTFLHKERKHHQAITLQSLSFMAWAQWHYLQARDYSKPYEKDLRKEAREQFVRWSRPSAVLDSLKRSIPKGGDKFDLSETVDYICEMLKSPERIKYDIAFVEIDRILHAHKGKVT